MKLVVLKDSISGVFTQTLLLRLPPHPQAEGPRPLADRAGG